MDGPSQKTRRDFLRVTAASPLLAPLVLPSGRTIAQPAVTDRLTVGSRGRR